MKKSYQKYVWFLALSILALHVEARGEIIAGKEYSEAFVWTAPGGVGVNRGAVGDLDGDGCPELVLCYGSADTGGKVVILRISGSTLETVQIISPPGAGGIKAFILNVDGQGLPELVTTTGALGGAASLAIYRYDGTEMAKLWEHGGFNGSTYVDVGDTDNDGVPELITAEATYGRKFCVWEPNGDFTSWSKSFCDSAGIADVDFAAVGDTDGDGQNEIFVNFRYWSPEEYRLYRYTGATYQKVWSWQPPLASCGPTTSYTGDGALGDFDGDGRQEMVMATQWYSPCHLMTYVFDWDGDSYEQVAVIDPDVSGTGYSNTWAGQLLGLDFNDVFSVTATTDVESQRTYFYAFEAGIYTLQGSLPGSLIAFGDLTCDGVPELVVRVPDGQGGYKASVYSIKEISALIDIDPDTFNRKSHGKWITVYITLPEGFDVGTIDTSSIAITSLIGEICDPEYTQGADLSFTPQVGDRDEDGILDLTVKFDRQVLLSNLCLDDVSITIEGELTTGELFSGSDSIRIIDRGK